MKLDLITLPSPVKQPPLLTFEAAFTSASLEGGRLKSCVNFLTHHAFPEHADKPVKLYSIHEDGITKTKVAELSRESELSNGICTRFLTEFLLDLDPGFSVEMIPTLSVSKASWLASEITWRCHFTALIRISAFKLPAETPLKDPRIFEKVEKKDPYHQHFSCGKFDFVAQTIDCLLESDLRAEENLRLNKWFRHTQILEFSTSGQFF